MTSLPFRAGDSVLRRWRGDDRESIAEEANNRAVWRNLTHRFPHPYTVADADWWIAQCGEQAPPRDLAVDIGGKAVGSCGIEVGEGVGQRTGQIGYWIGERYWDRGIGTAVVAALVDYAWDAFNVDRLQAEVFAWNRASARVLEKNHFHLEGTRRNAIFKDDQLIDEWMYVLFRPDSRRR